MVARICGALMAAVWLAGALPAVGADDQGSAPPAGSEAAARIDGLIKQLGDDSFFVREKAQAELEALGFEAFDALTIAESNPDIEIAARAKYLLRKVQVELARDDDPEEVKQLLENFETAEDSSRQERINRLAALPYKVGIGPLCRLARFVKSEAWSKRAALAVMGQGIATTPLDEIVTGLPCDETAAEALSSVKKQRPDPLGAFDDAQWAKRTELIEAGVANSPRAAAQWLRAYTKLRSKTDDSLKAWQPLVDEEIRVLERFPQQSDAEVVTQLLRQQLAWMQATGQSDAAEETLMRMVELERGEQGSLLELLHWLVDHQAWKAVDATAERFAASFQQQPLLAYTLAYARQKQGLGDKADELAAATLKANPGSHGDHYTAAIYLQQRGWIKWSEAEYRLVIELGPPENIYCLRSQMLLAELLHDRGDDKGAAELLAAMDKTFQALAEAGQDNASTGRDPEATRARMNFFYGAHYLSTKEYDKALEHLEEALPYDRTDADVLIALHRIPDLPEDKRAEISEMIKHAAEAFETQKRDDPENSTPYNQLAWLLSNTGGDAIAAIENSKKSLELKPNTAGYLDTLGRCYYAAGMFEEAVATQTLAVQMEPHSGQMSRQLALFKQALAEKQGK